VWPVCQIGRLLGNVTLARYKQYGKIVNHKSLI
jgi:hypothetical protein